MTIDPKTLPTGAFVECAHSSGPHTLRACSALGTIARVFVPVPEGMTYADAEAALADAGAWVEVESVMGAKEGTRVRTEWIEGDHKTRIYVHRDDLPPADPDRGLVEAIAWAIFERDAIDTGAPLKHYDLRAVHESYVANARAALAVVREHEAKS